MIEVKNLCKFYGEKHAVEDISFTVPDGIILGFLGPNGAGKSTTMNILTGYISSTSGSVKINGFDILEQPKEAKSQIGYLPEIPPVYPDMTVKEYLNFIYELKKCTLPREQHIKQICGETGIAGVYDRLIRNLSKGYKQRVGLAQALIANPPILILDEPTVGLDPQQIVGIRTLIKRLGKKHTVILSSHILSEIQAVCDKIIIINKGKVAANDTAENISRSLSDDERLIAVIDGDKGEITDMIKNIPAVMAVKALREREKGAFEYEIKVHENADIRRELFKKVANSGHYILAMTTTALSLEDIFMKITMGDNVVISNTEEAAAPAEKANDTEVDSDTDTASETAAEENDDTAADGGDK